MKENELATVLESFEQIMDKKLNEMNEKFERKFEEMESKFEKKFEEMESKFDKKFEEMESKFDKKFEEMDNKLERKFEELKAENRELREEIREIREQQFVFEHEYGKKIDAIFDAVTMELDKNLEKSKKIRKLEERTDRSEIILFDHEKRISKVELKS